MRWYLPDGNPLLWNEIRRLLRGGRVYVLFVVEVLVLLAVLAIFAADLPASNDVHAWSMWGERTFFYTMGCQYLLVIALSPSLCAQAISSEREQGSLDMLWLTPLTNRELIYGKFLGGVITLGFMLLGGMPVLAIVAVLGGVPFWWFLLGYLLSFVIGASIASLGLLASCHSSRTAHAIPLAYGYFFGLCVISGFCGLIYPLFIVFGIRAVLQRCIRHFDEERNHKIFPRYRKFLLTDRKMQYDRAVGSNGGK